MAVRLLKYFLIFFMFIMVFLLTKNPYSLKYNASGKNKPEIELFDVKNYEISKEGVSSIIMADMVKRYKNYDKLFDIIALHRGKLDLIDSLKANRGLFAKDILYLDDKVRYTRSDELALNSNSVKYDTKNKILSSSAPFVFTKKNVTTHGQSFVYDMQKGIIKADKIKTVIRTDK